MNDQRYRDFVIPVTDSFLNNFSRHHHGLDFGSGTAPVISKVLEEHGYHVRQYDPYFHPDSELLSETYDYIVCCEMIENIFHPAKEFELLKKML